MEIIKRITYDSGGAQLDVDMTSFFLKKKKQGILAHILDSSEAIRLS